MKKLLHVLANPAYYYRLWFGWLPFQLCMVCGRWYWGGWPYPQKWWMWLVFWKWQSQWNASWADYCSRRCCDIDMNHVFGPEGPWS